MSSSQESSKVIDAFVENNIQPAEDGINVYKELNASWEGLDAISQELAEHTMKFVAGTLQVIGDPGLLPFLDTDVHAFKASANIFLRDMHNFSIRVKRLRDQHEGRSGPINNDQDFELYTKLSAEYSDLYSQLMITMTPVMTDIVRIIHLNPAAIEYLDYKSTRQLNQPQPQEQVQEQATNTEQGVSQND
jgi:hypothetical protein